MEAEERTRDSALGGKIDKPNGNNAPVTEKLEPAKDASNHAPEHESGDDQNGANGLKRKRERSPVPEGMTRSSYKKLKRQQAWEAGKAERKAKEKAAVKAKKAARREAIASGLEPPPAPKPPQPKAVTVPVTIVIDCGFDDLMFEQEITSLASQITRCYSDNNKARYKVHLAVSGFDKRLKERFDTVLEQQYKGWKDIKFYEEDFVAVAEKVTKRMPDLESKDVIEGALKTASAEMEPSSNSAASEGEVIYLSSESEHTITHLKPGSIYIIGGLVDRNRHKGICYKTACDRGVKTAKLPIGEYLAMDSRKVLATNHVNEIMLKWLETGDWGDAFMKVMPKRKGGKLREQKKGEEPDEAEVEVGAGEEGGDDDEVEDGSQDGEAEEKADEAAKGADQALVGDEVG